MNTLQEAIVEYVNLQRSLGFKLERYGKALSDFVSFLEMRGANHITLSTALEWAQQPSWAKPVTWAHRLSLVRDFARYRSSTDPRTEIPPKSFFPARTERIKPYLYTAKEIEDLMEAALNIPKASAFTRQTYYCLFGLLSVTGMRLGEALGLKMSNVDLDTGVLTIEGTKFGKSRLVPLHASTCKVLSDYILCREQFLNGRTATCLFISKSGTQLIRTIVSRSFRRLSRRTGLRSKNANCGPRIHDLRHRYAIYTLLHWYQNGEDVERRLPVLSTYLGHVSISSTYWYLAACPELMGVAVQRLERYWEARS